MKKLTALILALSLTASLAACGNSGGGNSGASNGGNSSTSQGSSTSGSQASGSVQGLTEAIAEQPILLTSSGQSADYQIVGTVLKNLGLDYTMEATASELGDAKTLMIAVGGSSKGLGAAGIDADQELARVTALIDAAESAGVTIITLHTGGTTRRGDLSDKFIAPSFEKADYAIVVKEGDQDGMMAGICSTNGIPVDMIDSVTDLTTVLPAAFK